MSAGERWVLLGLARPRAAWFGEVARWATSASIPAEFVKCVSAEEVRARLASGRRHSALLVDLTAPGFDRDLVAEAAARGTVTIGVGDGRPLRWSATDIGLATVLDASFDRVALLDALRGAADPVERAGSLPPLLADGPLPRWRGRLVAVCGPGGSGASTVAVALAQAGAADTRHGGSVVLADLARRADQAVIHAAPDLGPGLQELAEAFRLGRPQADDVRATTFEVPSRGYRLLLGLRRPEAWSVLRPVAVDAALDGLRQAFHLTVADVAGDVEGEADGGSLDVEERNHPARAATAAADVVVVVGDCGLTGIHNLGRLIGQLVTSGVEPSRILPVLNRAPRGPRARAALSAALAVTTTAAGPVGAPVFVPERKVEEALRDGVALPGAVVTPVAAALATVLAAHGDAPPPQRELERIEPGRLGALDLPGA